MCPRACRTRLMQLIAMRTVGFENARMQCEPIDPFDAPASRSCPRRTTRSPTASEEFLSPWRPACCAAGAEGEAYAACAQTAPRDRILRRRGARTVFEAERAVFRLRNCEAHGLTDKRCEEHVAWIRDALLAGKEPLPRRSRTC